MTTEDIADEIYAELDSPSDTSPTAIAAWLVANIGQLNTLLNLEVTVESGQFVPELGLDEKDIFKQLYFVKYYDRKVNSNLGAASMDAGILEITEGNRTVRMVNRNEVSKVFGSQKREAYELLLELVNFYKINRSGPRQVIDGEDDC